jgi:hypothetical protein
MSFGGWSREVLSTIWRAFPRRALWTTARSVSNIRALLFSTGCSLVLYSIANYVGFEPRIVELVWSWLCILGVAYHFTGLRESIRERRSLEGWDLVDLIDIEVADNDIREEGSRLLAKLLFTCAGVTSMFMPPRVNEELDAWTQVLTAVLVAAVVALDVGAVLNRNSRIWQRLVLHAVHEGQVLRQQGKDAEE